MGLWITSPAGPLAPGRHGRMVVMEQQLRYTAELLAAEGMTRNELRRACRLGEWERIRHGAYLRAGERDERDSHRLLIEATLAAAGSDCVVSHMSAAVLHGLPLVSEHLDRVWVTRPRGGHGRHGPVMHVRRCPIDDDEIVLVAGIPVTSLRRTAVDLARVLSYEWGVIMCDAALARGVDSRDLLQVAMRYRSWPGGRRAEQAASFADPRSGSPAESLSRVQMARLGLPTPVLQFPVTDAGRLVATTDFGWETEGLVGEADGKVKYGTLLKPGQQAIDALMAEKRREERIRGAGFWVVRWGWAEASDPQRLGAILRRGFDHAPGLRKAA